MYVFCKAVFLIIIIIIIIITIIIIILLEVYMQDFDIYFPLVVLQITQERRYWISR